MIVERRFDVLFRLDSLLTASRIIVSFPDTTLPHRPPAGPALLTPPQCSSEMLVRHEYVTTVHVAFKDTESAQKLA